MKKEMLKSLISFKGFECLLNENKKGRYDFCIFGGDYKTVSAIAQIIEGTLESVGGNDWHVYFEEPLEVDYYNALSEFSFRKRIVEGAKNPSKGIIEAMNEAQAEAEKALKALIG